jgi:hypothetical protein
MQIWSTMVTVTAWVTPPASDTATRFCPRALLHRTTYIVVAFSNLLGPGLQRCLFTCKCDGYSMCGWSLVKEDRSRRSTNNYRKQRSQCLWIRIALGAFQDWMLQELWLPLIHTINSNPPGVGDLELRRIYVEGQQWNRMCASCSDLCSPWNWIRRGMEDWIIEKNCGSLSDRKDWKIAILASSSVLAIRQRIVPRGQQS